MDNTVLLTTISTDQLKALITESVTKCLASQPPARDPVPDEAAPTFVNKKEAARLISVCPSSIDNFARSGKLKRHYFGGKSVRFERSQVLALAKSHTNHKRSN